MSLCAAALLVASCSGGPGCPDGGSVFADVVCLPDGGPSFVPLSSFAASVGGPFVLTIQATCGQVPYTWSIGTEVLPQGVSVIAVPAEGTLVIEGKAAEGRTCPYLVDVTVRDSLGRTAMGTIPLQINP